ncbi:MAG: Gfo/Idh/MocA family oxidoreductase [Acidobacteriota bacterium]|nr:Gfo/Idh/MocA family oxidoreductase [Acidobacteriota bacterium]
MKKWPFFACKRRSMAAWRRTRAATFAALCSIVAVTMLAACSQAQARKVRLAIVGLNHDHVWGLLNDCARAPQADLVAIADTHTELIAKARLRVGPRVRFYSDYIKMLDDVKPDGVIITTETDHHLAIVRDCAKRGIDVEMEKPMATTGADAREMLRLAQAHHIVLMVNYVNNWFPSTQEMYREVKAGKLGPTDKIVVQFGHQGPREIGISKEFAEWLYDPVKNGGGALMDFGCYGAALTVWLEGMPQKVYARALTLKTSQHNRVEDDAVLLLEYPRANAIIEPSWDWPYTMERIEVFGLKGSLLALPQGLLHRAYNEPASTSNPDGQPVRLNSLPLEESNPIAYYVRHIQTHAPVRGILSGKLNVEVNEILDAAKQSIRRGVPVNLDAGD